MRNSTVVVASAALATAVVIGVIVVVAFNMGESRTVKTVAQTSPAAAPTSATPKPAASAPTKPRPNVTVTVTKHRTVPDRDVAPRPNYGGDDDAFLTAIAADGIKAPDDWAIKAGRVTCGTSYSYAYDYLTDGGLYSHHVQTFLDDWISTHGGC